MGHARVAMHPPGTEQGPREIPMSRARGYDSECDDR